MKTLVRTFGPLTLAAALAACGPAPGDETITHEKAEAEATAVLAGWTLETVRQESRHPLANNLKESVDVEAPGTARKMRLRFASIRMERDYDFLVIQDEWGNELERITGNHTNYVSRTLPSRRAKIVLETDSSVASWGYVLDQIRHRGCESNPPQAAALQTASSCAALENAIKARAVKEVRRRFTEGYYPGPWTLRGAAPNAPAPEAAPAHSETNVQVQGVDEADIVKTDGNYIYTVTGHELRIYRSWPVGGAALLHQIRIEGWAKELFVFGDRVIVLSGVPGDFIGGGGGGPRPIGGARLAPIWWRPEAFTKLTVFRFQGGTPELQEELLLAGQYNTARRVGTAVRLVLNRELRWPELQYWPANVEHGTREFEAAQDALEAEAVQIVQRRPLSDWLPSSYRVVNGQRQALGTNCRDFLVPSSADELGLSSVVTVDLGTPAPSIQDTSMLVRADKVYQSLENLYVSAPHQWSCWEDAGTEGEHTYLHQLSLTNPLRTTYRASGGVPGALLNQFSMDEHAGHLRVATTKTRWSMPTPEEQTSNHVTVLAPVGRELRVVGETELVAPGERIFSSRFVEDKGYVVTFRQVDPLFVIDLSVPTRPQVLGELKIPGFSTYLHVLDADHLFAVGNDFEADGTTRNGVALSIYDVSDAARPRLKHKAVVGSTSGYSEALYDHKAFTSFRDPNTDELFLAIPFTDWTQNAGEESFFAQFTSSLKVFRISPLGIMGTGELDLSDLYAANQESNFGWWYAPNIRRGVFVDQYVFAVSDAGLKAAEFKRPANVVAVVPAPAQLEEPAAPADIVTSEGSAEPRLAIPDNDPRGVTSVIHLADSLTVERLTVDLEINHTYRGDLVVSIEHDGVSEVLHDRTGGSADDLVRSFSTSRFAGLEARGDWTLKVTDLARADVGHLVRWSVLAVGRGTANPTQSVERVFGDRPSLSIPDNKNSGLSVEIEVNEDLEVSGVELELEIQHSYRGDLVVRLEHDGVSAVVHDRQGGSADDLRVTTNLDAFAGRNARGTWKLTVADVAAFDTGTLERYQLTLRGQTR